MRKLILRLAALVIVCVFASLPTLARIHDRLSTHDDVSSFRLSKNLERPHEKIVAAAVAPTADRMARGDSLSGPVRLPAEIAVAFDGHAPRGSRAPPLR